MNNSTKGTITHGTDYEKYSLMISKCVTIKDIIDIADMLAGIHDPTHAQLTEKDIIEFQERLRKAAEDRARKISDITMFPSPVKGMPEPKGGSTEQGIMYGVDKDGIAQQPPKQKKRGKEKNPNEHNITGISSQVYRYQTPIIDNDTVNGETFQRDYELERTIQNNGMLPFTKKWYDYPPSSPLRGGWSIEKAMVEAVEYQHKFTWQDLEKKYNIPKHYVDEWKQIAKRIRENK